MNTPAIQAHGLSESYAGQAVLDGLELTVGAGPATALLGLTVPARPRSISPSPRSSRPSAACCSAPRSETAILAVGWCVVIVVAGWLWSTAIYERQSVAGKK